MNVNSLWYAVQAANVVLARETVQRERRKEKRVQQDLTGKQRLRRSDSSQKLALVKG